MSNESDTSSDTLDSVKDIIYDIENRSADGDYIYRGEPEHHEDFPYYGKISSSLYRQYARIEADEFNIKVVQEEILAEAKTYSHETEDPVEILTQLQHHGGKTNLIDFTTDYLIALFFACDNSDSLTKDGRLILLQKTDEWQDLILRPRNPRHRVIAQKSVFVQHPNGFLTPEDVDIITIPAYLKLPTLAYLQKYHDISTETIYNDLHGFITNQRFHENAYLEFHRGLTYHLKGNEVEASEEKQAAYEKAVMHYTRAIRLKPDIPEGYNNRGNVYYDKGDVDKAIKDYNKAIEYNPDDALLYNNRGSVYFDEGSIDKAIEDWNKAVELDPDFAKAYYNRGNAYLVKGEIDKAIKDYNRVTKLNPEDVDAYITRGEAYLEKDDFDRAMEEYNKAIELKPEDADVYVIRAKAYHENGDFDFAMGDYEKAIELNSDDAEAYYNLGLVWMQRQNWQEAKLNLTVAKILKADIVSKFHNTYESIADFEQQNDIDLPEDIAAMLTS